MQKDNVAKHGQFAIIPARALDDSRVDDKHLRALSVLGTYADKNGWCFPSLSTVSDWLMVSRSSMSEIFHDLEEWGYLLIIHREDDSGAPTSNKYRIIHDAELQEEFDLSNPSNPVRKSYEDKKQGVRQSRLAKKQGVRNSLGKNVPNAPLNVPNECITDQQNKSTGDTTDMKDESGIEWKTPSRGEKLTPDERKVSGMKALEAFEKSKDKKKRKAIADAWGQSKYEEQVLASRLASIGLRHALTVEDMANQPSAFTGDWIFKARQLLGDITGGKITREQADGALEHFENGGGAMYDKWTQLPTAAQVLKDVESWIVQREVNVPRVTHRGRNLGI